MHRVHRPAQRAREARVHAAPTPTATAAAAAAVTEPKSEPDQLIDREQHAHQQAAQLPRQVGSEHQGAVRQVVDRECGRAEAGAGEAHGGAEEGIMKQSA